MYNLLPRFIGSLLLTAQILQMQLIIKYQGVLEVTIYLAKYNKF